MSTTPEEVHVTEEIEVAVEASEEPGEPKVKVTVVTKEPCLLHLNAIKDVPCDTDITWLSFFQLYDPERRFNMRMYEIRSKQEKFYTSIDQRIKDHLAFIKGSKRAITVKVVRRNGNSELEQVSPFGGEDIWEPRPQLEPRSHLEPRPHLYELQAPLAPINETERSSNYRWTSTIVRPRGIAKSYSKIHLGPLIQLCNQAAGIDEHSDRIENSDPPGLNLHPLQHDDHIAYNPLHFQRDNPLLTSMLRDEMSEAPSHDHSSYSSRTQAMGNMIGTESNIPSKTVSQNISNLGIDAKHSNLEELEGSSETLTDTMQVDEDDG